MKILINIIFITLIISYNACKEATEDTTVVSFSAICTKELVHDIDDNTSINYTLCKEANSTDLRESLNVFCGNTPLITNGTLCSDVINPSSEHGKCVFSEVSLVLIGNFFNDGTDEQKNTFLSGKESECEAGSGTWTQSSGE